VSTQERTGFCELTGRKHSDGWSPYPRSPKKGGLRKKKERRGGGWRMRKSLQSAEEKGMVCYVTAELRVGK